MLFPMKIVYDLGEYVVLEDKNGKMSIRNKSFLDFINSIFFKEKNNGRKKKVPGRLPTGSR